MKELIMTLQQTEGERRVQELKSKFHAEESQCMHVWFSWLLASRTRAFRSALTAQNWSVSVDYDKSPLLMIAAGTICLRSRSSGRSMS